jgi:hypothetical protein
MNTIEQELVPRRPKKLQGIGNTYDTAGGYCLYIWVWLDTGEPVDEINRKTLEEYEASRSTIAAYEQMKGKTDEN